MGVACLCYDEFYGIEIYENLTQMYENVTLKIVDISKAAIAFLPIERNDEEKITAISTREHDVRWHMAIIKDSNLPQVIAALLFSYIYGSFFRSI